MDTKELIFLACYSLFLA
uniref:Uncharacterized protein n=1 Tax=Rhizophora mucronata TaxID=61149 RepID=A0A2P2NK50_RHIMU